MPQLEPYWSLPYDYNASHRQQFDILGYSELAKHIIFMHENWLQPFSGLERMCIRIKKAQQESGRFPVLCFDYNYLMYNDIIKILDQEIGETNYFMLVADPRFGVNKNTGLWPYGLIELYPYKNYQNNQPKQYRLSFLSGVLRYHRLKLWDCIRDYITVNDAIVINKFCEDNYENSFNHQQVSFESAKQLLQQSLPCLPWSNLPAMIDNDDQNLCNSINHCDNLHPAYNAMINITGETLTGDDVMITEKTWKAYRSGCLVVNFGSTDTPLYLKQMGLEIWEEYDPCLPIDDKIKLITELFKRTDINQMYEKSTEMIKYNQNLVTDINFIKKQSLPAAEKLQSRLR